MTTVAAEPIIRRAGELAKDGDAAKAVDQLIAQFGPDRAAFEEARDEVAAHLHREVGDWEATATLTVLNRVLSRIPRADPFDWRVRWTKHRKP
jgi:hypothetical protein